MKIAAMIGAAAFATLVVNSTALAEGAEGLWITKGSCARLGDGGWVQIDRQGIEFYETSCKFGRTAPAGFPGVKGAVQCTGEGEYWVSDVSISATGDRLTLSSGGVQTVYRRCPSTSAGVPAPATDANAAAAAVMLGVLGTVIYRELQD